MDKMILLGESKIQVLVISPKWNEVQSMLYDQIDRGCTLMNITTGYKKTRYVCGDVCCQPPRISDTYQ